MATPPLPILLLLVVVSALVTLLLPMTTTKTTATGGSTSRRELHGGWLNVDDDVHLVTGTDDLNVLESAATFNETDPDGWPELTSDDHAAAALAQTTADVVSGRSGGSFPQITIPVAFHAIYKSDGVTGMVSYAAIQAQVAQLNRAFSGEEARSAGFPRATDANFRFTLYSVDYTLNDDWHDNCALWNYQQTVKQALMVNPAKYYNVYLCHATSSLGLSWIPYQAFKAMGTSSLVVPAEDSWMLGTILHWELLPGSKLFGGRWNQGDILAHETGHHLGLMHMYQGGCLFDENYSDQILDTPRQNGNPSGTCAQLKGLNSCSNPCPDCVGGSNMDDNSNYMGIAADACRSHYTPGQVTFMQNTVTRYKPTLMRQLPVDCVAAVDSSDNSPDLAPCVGSVQPAGTGGRDGRWCVTSKTDSTQWGWACCASDGASCRTGSFSLARSGTNNGGGGRPTTKATGAPVVPATTTTSAPHASGSGKGSKKKKKKKVMSTLAPTSTTSDGSGCTWRIQASNAPCQIPFTLPTGLQSEPVTVKQYPPYKWVTMYKRATPSSLWCPFQGVTAYSSRSASVKAKWGLAVCV